MRIDVLLKPHVLFSLIFGIIIVIVGIIKISNKAQPETLPYSLSKPTRTSIKQYVSASGTLKAQKQSTVGSIMTGQLIKMLVRENDVVKQGQLLAQLDNGGGKYAADVIKGQLLQAIAQLTFQEKTLARQRVLFESGELAENSFDQTLLQYELAAGKVQELQASLKIEEQKLEDLHITAPIAGTVTLIKADEGQIVGLQSDTINLFTIVEDLTQLEVWADIDEADAGLVQEGHEVSFHVDAHPQALFHSRVKQLLYNPKIAEGSVSFAAIIPADNRELKLRPGMTANVEIKVADQDQALTVPYSAQRINSLLVKEYATKNNIPCQPLPDAEQAPHKKIDSIWLWQDNSFKQRQVTFGARDGSRIEIIDGVTEQDDVVIRFVPNTDGASALIKAMGGGSIGNNR